MGSAIGGSSGWNTSATDACFGTGAGTSAGTGAGTGADCGVGRSAHGFVRLRTKTLLVGLLSLGVPIIGWQSIKQLHSSLQQTRVDAQTLRAVNLGNTLRDAQAVSRWLAIGDDNPGNEAWYAETARWPLFVDGYADDWQELRGSTANHEASGDPPISLSFLTARRGPSLYLFVKVQDADVAHHVPPILDPDAGENESPDPHLLLANGDTIELFVQQPDGVSEHALFSVIAPGPVDVVHASDTKGIEAGSAIRGWRAAWVDVPDGYQLEIELPLPAPGSRIGIAAIDSARSDGSPDDSVEGAPYGRVPWMQRHWVGTLSPDRMRELMTSDAAETAAETAGILHYESDALRRLLEPWVVPGTRARLFDEGGRLLADANDLYSPLPESESTAGSVTANLLDASLLRLFAWFAAGDLPLYPETEKSRQPLHLEDDRRPGVDELLPTTRYVTVDNDRLLGTLIALDEQGVDRPRGYLLYESNEEHASAVASSPLARLFALLVLATLMIGSLLFAWATRLSLRIRRLSLRASQAVDRDGRVATLVGSGANDEIGDLSRNLADLLARSAAYTRYLESLSKHLSHELGTPLSIVRTSIENVDRQKLDGETRRLLDRASGGADRLGGIVRALLESARLEQSVQHAEFVDIALLDWLREAAVEYAQVHPEHRFRVALSLRELDAPGSVTIPALPDSRARVAPALLRQALDKLVDNACDFATASDIVLLLTPGTPLGLAVANRGARLTAAEISLLFSPASDVAASRREGEPVLQDAVHSGSGLYLVRLIAEAHDGNPIAFSQAAGVAADHWLVIGLSLPSR